MTAPKCASNLAKAAATCVWLTDIGLDFQSAAAISADFIDDGLTGGGLQIHNADRRAFSGKTRGNTAANSPRSAGDQGHFSF